MLVNTILRRKPEHRDGTGWDRIRCVGIFDTGPDNGGRQLVFAPAESHDSPMSCAEDDQALWGGYDVESEPDVDGPWETAAGEIGAPA